MSVIVVAAVLLITVIASTASTRRAARQAAGNPFAIKKDDTDGRTRPLTAGERAVLERRFTVIDTDGNGVWQREDYEQLTRRLCGTFGHAIDSVTGQAVAFGAAPGAQHAAAAHGRQRRPGDHRR